MTRPGYTMTEIGEIPEDWGTSKLSKIFKVFTGTTPSTKIRKYWSNGSIEWLTPKDLGKMADSLVIPSSEKKITPEAMKQSGLNLIPEESILISTRAPVGYVGVNKPKVTFNQGCKGLVPIEHESTDSSFYAYYLKYMKNFLVSVSSGSTFKELSKERLTDLDMPIPPFPEQQKIAEILSTADEAIQMVNDQITQTERLKKGLMQTLLTRGIGHTKFRMTEIGKIPEEWSTTNIAKSSYIKGRIGWQGLTTKEYLNSGDYFLVTGTEFIEGKVDWNKCHFVSKERYDQDKHIQLQRGDILVTKDGTIGKTALISDLPKPATLNSGVFVIRPLKNSYFQLFMFYVLQSQVFDRFIKILRSGSTISHLYQNSFDNFEFPLPSIEEQQKIAEIFTTVDDKLNLLRNKKEYLEKLKKGLMRELLTGRIRVKV